MIERKGNERVGNSGRDDGPQERVGDWFVVRGMDEKLVSVSEAGLYV